MDDTTVTFVFWDSSSPDAADNSCSFLFNSLENISSYNALQTPTKQTTRHLRAKIKINSSSSEVVYCLPSTLTSVKVNVSFIYKLLVIDEKEVTVDNYTKVSAALENKLSCSSKVSRVEFGARTSDPILAKLNVFLLCQVDNLII